MGTVITPPPPVNESMSPEDLVVELGNRINKVTEDMEKEFNTDMQKTLRAAGIKGKITCSLSFDLQPAKKKTATKKK